MTDYKSPGWCDKHAELFRVNGVSPEEIYHQVVTSLMEHWQKRTELTMPHDRESVEKVISAMGDGKPFCCWIGDEKLQKFLISVATRVEKMKEGRNAENPDN